MSGEQPYKRITVVAQILISTKDIMTQVIEYLVWMKLGHAKRIFTDYS
jgi:hypothetical protein